MTIVMPSEATVSRAPGLKIAFVAPARYPIREPYACLLYTSPSPRDS